MIYCLERLLGELRDGDKDTEVEGRKVTKEFNKLEGSQGGFVGMMALCCEAENLTEKGELSEAQDGHDKEIAQNIGFVLKESLDLGFRDEEDLEAQKAAFVKMFDAYQEPDVLGDERNLLEMMLHPKKTKPGASYQEKFENMSPSEQARFAILVKHLENRNSFSDISKALPGKYKDSTACAKRALNNSSKLSVGDKIELLKSFGEEALGGKLTYEQVADELTSWKFSILPSSIERDRVTNYNAGIKLAEIARGFYRQHQDLTDMGQKKAGNALRGLMKHVSRLSSQEQYKFLRRLKEQPERDQIPQQMFDEIAVQVEQNYNDRNKLFDGFKDLPLPEDHAWLLQERASRVKAQHSQVLQDQERRGFGQSLEWKHEAPQETKQAENVGALLGQASPKPKPAPASASVPAPEEGAPSDSRLIGSGQQRSPFDQGVLEKLRRQVDITTSRAVSSQPVDGVALGTVVREKSGPEDAAQIRSQDCSLML